MLAFTTTLVSCILKNSYKASRFVAHLALTGIINYGYSEPVRTDKQSQCSLALIERLLVGWSWGRGSVHLCQRGVTAAEGRTLSGARLQGWALRLYHLLMSLLNPSLFLPLPLLLSFPSSSCSSGFTLHPWLAWGLQGFSQHWDYRCRAWTMPSYWNVLLIETCSECLGRDYWIKRRMFTSFGSIFPSCPLKGCAL